MTRGVACLRMLAKRWGGSVEHLTPSTYTALVTTDGWCEAPFSANGLAVHWWDKRVVFTRPVVLGELIHEMGHVFADPNPPKQACELNWTVWEYRVAVAAGATRSWRSFMNDYVLDDDREWQYLTFREQNAYLRKRYAAARARDLLDVNLNPRAIR